MKLAIIASNLLVPIIMVYILCYGISKRVDIYNAFVEGAKEGFSVVLGILPTLIGLMTAVGILRAGGALELLENALRPLMQRAGMPVEVIPLCILRLVSSSASTGILLDIFKNFSTDSFTGRFVSVMMYCTESMVYVMSIYFLSVNIKKPRHTIAGGLVANMAGVAASYFICKMIWG